jgi:hypothetical protein
MKIFPPTASTQASAVDVLLVRLGLFWLMRPAADSCPVVVIHPCKAKLCAPIGPLHVLSRADVPWSDAT